MVTWILHIAIDYEPMILHTISRSKSDRKILFFINHNTFGGN